jgi:hypothetical protein
MALYGQLPGVQSPWMLNSPGFPEVLRVVLKVVIGQGQVWADLMNEIRKALI